MEIKGDTIYFKTGPDWFRSEEDGTKPFTIRLVTEKEYDDISLWWMDQYNCAPPRKICIESMYSGASFVRQVELVGNVGHLLGNKLIFISWRHVDDDYLPQ